MRKRQTEIKTQSHDEWHEERYGEHRDKLSDDRLSQIVEDICGKNIDYVDSQGNFITPCFY